MKQNKYLLLLFLLLSISCESLEDTYSEFGAAGITRYLAKCKNVDVNPGWERLVVTWENSVDPLIDQVLVKWELGDKIDSTFLPRGTELYNITTLNGEALVDGTYKVSVCGVDKNMFRSLNEDMWARPYTYDHESIRSFSSVVSNHYYIQDITGDTKLVLFMASWNDNISSAALHYVTKDGEKIEMTIDKDFVSKYKYYVIPESVHHTDLAYVERIGKVVGCDDLILFRDFILNKDIKLSSDIRSIIKTKYGVDEPNADFLSSLTEFGYDYNVASFEDLLYMPNLTNVNLAKERYMYEPTLSEYTYSTSGISVLEDEAKSKFVIEQLINLKGVTVERYNKHYFPYSTPRGMVSHGNPTPAAIAPIMRDDSWEIECSQDETLLGTRGKTEYLFDNDVTTIWNPSAEAFVRDYLFEIDFQNITDLSGIKVVQETFTDAADARDGTPSRPRHIEFSFSDDYVTWKKGTYDNQNTLGTTNGEITIINLTEVSKARYVRISLVDQGSDTGSTYDIALSDIVFF